MPDGTARMGRKSFVGVLRRGWLLGHRWDERFGVIGARESSELTFDLPVVKRFCDRRWASTSGASAVIPLESGAPLRACKPRRTSAHELRGQL